MKNEFEKWKNGDTVVAFGYYGENYQKGLIRMIEELKKLKNKMAIEVLVFESLKHEELTKDFIDSFVNIMTKNYKDNIAFIEGIINGEK